MSYLTFTGTLEIITCCHEDCKQKFAMEDALYRQRKNDHYTFYCPRGHKQHFPDKSNEELLQQELQQQKEKIERLEQSRTSLHTLLTNERTGRRNEVRSLKGAKTRILNRVKNGVCPCCNRSFSNLKRHMDSKHPDHSE